MPVYKVTIMPRGQALGVTHFLPEGDKYSWSKKQILAHIDSSLGGKIAEELIYGTDNVTGGCSSVGFSLGPIQVLVTDIFIRILWQPPATLVVW